MFAAGRGKHHVVVGTGNVVELWIVHPQVVNAFYNPQNNEILFPAAFLQPPYFDANADPASTSAGCGANAALCPVEVDRELAASAGGTSRA